MNKSLLLAILLNINMVQIYSQTKNFLDQPYIETLAKVDTMVVPDRIYLVIAVSEKDTKGKISVEELESKMVNALKSIGIDTEKNLALNDLSCKLGKYIIKGEDILKTKVYSLVVENALTAGKVMIELEKIEISNVSIERIEYSKIEELNLTLKSKAVIKAKKQAEAMCYPLNKKVGPAIFISDISDNSLQNFYQYSDERYNESRNLYMSSAKEVKLSDLQFDKIKVESFVSVKFKIE